MSFPVFRTVRILLQHAKYVYVYLLVSFDCFSSVYSYNGSIFPSCHPFSLLFIFMTSCCRIVLKENLQCPCIKFVVCWLMHILQSFLQTLRSRIMADALRNNLKVAGTNPSSKITYAPTVPTWKS